MFEHEIRNKIPILLALSTCPRCIRMKEFLKNNRVNATVVDVDLLALEERKSIYRFIKTMNPQLSFPTLIIGDLAVVGEDYDGVKEVLGL